MRRKLEVLKSIAKATFSPHRFWTKFWSVVLVTLGFLVSHEGVDLTSWTGFYHEFTPALVIGLLIQLAGAILTVESKETQNGTGNKPQGRADTNKPSN